ncbi:haloacid dehalogenase type II [Nitrogeniibacter aestuarii]|uniref:haloacid dehalogenase type II n=1 Tax=Nitrogeniibacter aestuarii TaxID=2815343 RepID=UPI001D0FF6F6|nr:haloacid dehalogenase type II [Nitrogeniibacter aestuarii]
MNTNRLKGIEVCVFDAYGTLFDVSSVARASQAALGEHWQALSDLWRSKQLQYTWLRAVSGHHADFWKVTEEALEFALRTLRIQHPGLRDQLMDAYLKIQAYPETKPTLERLHRAGLKTAVLSNGTPAMLKAAVTNAGLNTLLDRILSVESVGVFKPHPKVYELACTQFGVTPDKICFVSSNGWDAYSAQAYGFQVLWCNRFDQMPEQIPDTPRGEITTLAELPAWLGMH